MVFDFYIRYGQTIVGWRRPQTPLAAIFSRQARRAYHPVLMK
ncbi:MAG TPA: hypothetical protein VFU69_08860 [Ktedonobacterales bacterium]|nr:hypothetical protein [Ktedonobacterales bacterium]